MAVSIIIVWKVPKLKALVVLQPISLTQNAWGSNKSGKALKRRNCTQRNTSCTCSAKIVIQLDQYSFHLVCGVGDNNHRGHPPMTPNKITNCKRFLDVPTLENAAAMAAANIRPSQAALFTQTSTGELFTRGQMAYIEGFSSSRSHGFVTWGYCSSPWYVSGRQYAESSPKNGASFVCLYHNGKEEIHGQIGKAARTEGNPVDDGVHLTSLPKVTTAERAPSHKFVPLLEVSETEDFKEYAQKSWHAVGARDNQGILIACCWVLPDSRHIFQAFPEVVCIDGTHETNNKSKPLIYTVCRRLWWKCDGSGQMLCPKLKILVVPLVISRSPSCTLRCSNMAIG